PFLTGADVYKRALAYDGSWSQRFVFVTGASSQRSVGDFLNGVDARILFKPVPPERLIEAIRRVEANLPPRSPPHRSASQQRRRGRRPAPSNTATGAEGPRRVTQRPGPKARAE